MTTVSLSADCVQGTVSDAYKDRPFNLHLTSCMPLGKYPNSLTLFPQNGANNTYFMVQK